VQTRKPIGEAEAHEGSIPGDTAGRERARPSGCAAKAGDVPGAILCDELDPVGTLLGKDVPSLRARHRLTVAGVPIRRRRGRHGGFTLAATSDPVAVRLTAGEIATVIASLSALGPYTTATGSSALDKLLHALTGTHPNAQ